MCDYLSLLISHSTLQLVKRIRKVKALAYIIGHLKAQMPTLMGKEKKQQKLISNMPNVFRTVMKKYNLAPGDFPVSELGCGKRSHCKKNETNSLLVVMV